MQQPDDATEHVTQMHQKLVEEAERERDEPAREEQVRELVERWKGSSWHHSNDLRNRRIK